GADDFVHTNCFGTNIVMDTARRLELDRVVHISTDEVYGSIPVGSSEEDDALDPRSPYAASKAGSDLIALSYFHTYGLPVVVTRCTNNFGPYQFPEKAIPLFTTNLLDGVPLPLYGDGLNERDWLYVDDHCAAVEVVRERGAVGEIYNIGAGNETPNRVLVDKLLALLEVGEEMVRYVEDRKGHDRRYSVDIAKVTALGWRRARTLDEALEETVAWYRDNRWWWEPLKAGS
ncbi:MAG: GDP-mannose 4,6-dehydratase, partial [Acidimicrobiales bacterium]